MEVIKVALFLYASISPVFPSGSARLLHYEPTLTNEDSCVCYPKHHSEIGEKLANDIFYKNPIRIVLNGVHNKIRDNTVTPIGLEVGNTEEVNHESVDSNIFGAEIVATPQQDPIVPPRSVFDDGIYNPVWSGTTEDTEVKIHPKAKPWHKDIQKEKWQGNVHNNYWYRPEKQWTVNSEILPIYHNIVGVNRKGNANHNAPSTDFYTPNIQDAISSIDRKQHLTFNKWFVQQMKRFKNVNLPGEINTINTIALRSLIRKTLKDNNMYVTTDGMLIDSYGTALDVANLELRPMLLGNPVEYYKVLHRSDNLKLRKDLPYLEGILVTLIYPPKVLGIIPLGKTTLSHVSGPKEIKQTRVRISAIPKTLPNDPLPHKELPDEEPTKVSLVSDLPHRINKHSIVSKNIPEINHEDAPAKEKIKNGKHSVRKTYKSNTKVIPSDWKTDDHVGSEINQNQSRRFITGKILSKLYEMLSESRREHVDETEEEDDDDDETYFRELPDFRIIGGNAATSSGAPVSNKGRSGIISV